MASRSGKMGAPSGVATGTTAFVERPGGGLDHPGTDPRVGGDLRGKYPGGVQHASVCDHVQGDAETVQVGAGEPTTGERQLFCHGRRTAGQQPCQVHGGGQSLSDLAHLQECRLAGHQEVAGQGECGATVDGEPFDGPL